MMERICLILLANIIFFTKTITYGYVSDDIPVLRRSQKLKLGFWKKRALQLEGDIRVDAPQDHLLTTIIHALVCVFIYLSFGASDVSFIAAFLFAFNPINNQGSVWISGRTYPITALLIMATMVFPIIAPLSILGLMHYPIGFIMSAILVIWQPWFAIFVLLAGMFHVKRLKGLVSDKTSSEMFTEDRSISPKKLILVVKTLSFYTIHALIPLKTTFYHSFMQSMAGSGSKKAYSFDRYFWLGLIITAGMAYKVFFTHWDLASFGLVWWVVGLSPYLNAFRISQETAERYTYAPLVGLMMVLSTVLQGHPTITAAFIAMYATKLWFVMDMYQDDFYLVEHSCLADPGAWFAWHVKGLKRWDVQSYKEALILWTMAKRISPNEFKVLFNIATILKNHKQDEEAEAFITKASQNIPRGQEEQFEDLLKKWRAGEWTILI